MGDSTGGCGPSAPFYEFHRRAGTARGGPTPRRRAKLGAGRGARLCRPAHLSLAVERKSA